MCEETEKRCQETERESFNEGVMFFVFFPGEVGVFEEEKVQPDKRDEAEEAGCGEDGEEAGVGATGGMDVHVFDEAFLVVYVFESVVAAAEDGAFFDEGDGLTPGLDAEPCCWIRVFGAVKKEGVEAGVEFAYSVSGARGDVNADDEKDDAGEE